MLMRNYYKKITFQDLKLFFIDHLNQPTSHANNIIVDQFI